MNNPLMYTDPSGYNWNSYWTGRGHWAQRNAIPIASTLVAVAVGVVVGVATAGIGDIVIAGFLTGAAAGASSGLTGAVLHKQNLDGCLSATISGGFIGGATGIATAGVMAGIGYGVGLLNNTALPFGSGNFFSNSYGGVRIMPSTHVLQFVAGSTQLVAGVSNGAVIGGAIGGATSASAVSSLLMSTGAIGPPMAGLGTGGYYGGTGSGFAWNNTTIPAQNVQFLNYNTGNIYQSRGFINIYFDTKANDYCTAQSSNDFDLANGTITFRVHTGATPIDANTGWNIFNNPIRWADPTQNYFRINVGGTWEYGAIPLRPFCNNIVNVNPW
jgi:hypothetical protein